MLNFIDLDRDVDIYNTHSVLAYSLLAIFQKCPEKNHKSERSGLKSETW